MSVNQTGAAQREAPFRVVIIGDPPQHSVEEAAPARRNTPRCPWEGVATFVMASEPQARAREPVPPLGTCLAVFPQMDWVHTVAAAPRGGVKTP